MNFKEFISYVENDSSAIVKIPEGWGQGRATFGGLLAAAMYTRIPADMHLGRSVRSVQVSFVSPASPSDIEIVPVLLRQGKSAAQVQVTAKQNDQVCAVILASFGGDRESVVNIRGEIASVFKKPEEVNAFPFIPNLTPDFTQYFDYRYTLGTFPFMGSDKNELGGWIKFKEEDESLISVAQIIALFDAWPPAVFCVLKKPASGSSLSWCINFFQIPIGCSANDWWQYKSVIVGSENGYSHIDAILWDKNGAVCAIGRQVVSVFA